MKEKPKAHSQFRGVEIVQYPKLKQFAATFCGCQMLSPDVNVIRRAILRRKALVNS